MMKEKLPQQYWEFAEIFSKKASDQLPLHKDKVNHDIILKNENNLTLSSLYSMSLKQLKLIKAYLKNHLKKDFIVLSDALYASSVLFAKKPEEKWHFCVDYWKLNAIIKKNRYFLPLIEETLAWLVRVKVFIKLNVQQAFYWIRMKKSVEDLIIFQTRYRFYKYKVLSFNLCNSSAFFQRYINDILFNYLNDFCTVYMNDILIYSDNLLKHDAQVKKMLQHLKKAELQADIKKSEFSVQSIKFLSFIISTEGIAMNSEKVTVVKNWSISKSVKEIQFFLSFCNFYCNSLKKWDQVIRSLTKLTAKRAWHTLEELEIQTFKKVKELVLSDAIWVHYSSYAEIRMKTDISDEVVTRVLTQLQKNEKWKSAAYFSKTMSSEEMCYEIYDKEMLTVVRALQKWQGMLLSL